MRFIKNLYHFCFNKITITLLFLVFQVLFFVFEILKFSSYYAEIDLILRGISVLAGMYLISRSDNPSVKLAWIVPIMLFPLLGGILFLLFGHIIVPKKMQENMKRTEDAVEAAIDYDETIFTNLKDQNQSLANISSYLKKYAKAPLYSNTDCLYFSDGEDYWNKLVEDLESAKRYIFMEFFIIEEGIMWNRILEVLKKKVAEGVEVRLMYDDIGSLFLLPRDYKKQMEKAGIKCVAFNRLVPVVAMIMNNRDHRKIVVIDGKIGYTGGVNLADEYINKKQRFGRWKDTGVRLSGDAVWSLCVMFLYMWNTSRDDDSDYSIYKADGLKEVHLQPAKMGFLQPYGDTPWGHEEIGENVYMNMIAQARKYVHITTPYLITDHDMLNQLCLAAKRGVEVIIITPEIPDKKLVYYVTQSNYPMLLQAGVKIYQYTPGFIHAKMVVCDGQVATVGTINFDYRSFYHHFECGVIFYLNAVIENIEKDILDTLAISEEVTLDYFAHKKFRISILDPLLKLFSPLM